MPREKAAKIEEVKSRGLTVAIESADIVLVLSDPRDALSIVQLARAPYRKMVQNLWWATGYNGMGCGNLSAASWLQGV